MGKDALLPFAPDVDPSERETLYLFQRERAGWLVVRDGVVQSRAPDRARFEGHLRSEVRRRVAERFPASVLLPGRVVGPADGRVLEIDVDDGTSEPESSWLLLVGPSSVAAQLRPWAETKFMEMQIAEAAEFRPTRVVLREPAFVGGHAPSEISSGSRAVLRVTGAVHRLGQDSAASLDLLLSIAGGCPEYHWHGRPEGIDRTRLVVGDPQAPERASGACREVDLQEEVDSIRLGKLRPAMAPDLLLRKIEEGWLAVNSRSGRPLLLDEQALAVLRLLDGHTSLHDIAAVGSEVFDEGAETIETKLLELIDVFSFYGVTTHTLPPGDQHVAYGGATAPYGTQSESQNGIKRQESQSQYPGNP